MQFANEKKFAFLLFADVLLLPFILFSGNLCFISLTLLLWGNIIFFCFSNFKEHYLLFSFMIAFFLFLIGREAMEQFGIHDVQYPTLRKYDVFAEKQVFFSLVFIMVGYLLVMYIWKPKEKKTIFFIPDSKTLMVRKVSKYTYYITYVPNLLLVAESFLAILRKGYAAYYVSFSSAIPYFVRKIGEMSPIAFWLYMATLPSKKSAYPNVILFVFYLMTTLLTGQRSTFATGLLTLFVYFVLRDKWNKQMLIPQDKWIGKTEKRIIVVAIPILIVLMYMINVVRFGKNTSSGASDPLTEFIYGQGVSINVIKRVELYKHNLPKNKIYTFGSFIDFLQGNVISRLIGIKHYSGNNYEHAMYGPSLSHAISYCVLGDAYLKGNGIGSCFIAEAYHDWGYFGIAAVSLVYGAIIRVFFRKRSSNIWITAVLLIMLNSIYMAPRGSADGFIADLVDMTVWGTLLVIAVISFLCRSEIKKE